MSWFDGSLSRAFLAAPVKTIVFGVLGNDIEISLPYNVAGRGHIDRIPYKAREFVEYDTLKRYHGVVDLSTGAYTSTTEMDDRRLSTTLPLDDQMADDRVYMKDLFSQRYAPVVGEKSEDFIVSVDVYRNASHGNLYHNDNLQQAHLHFCKSCNPNPIETRLNNESIYGLHWWRESFNGVYWLGYDERNYDRQKKAMYWLIPVGPIHYLRLRIFRLHQQDYREFDYGFETFAKRIIESVKFTPVQNTWSDMLTIPSENAINQRSNESAFLLIKRDVHNNGNSSNTEQVMQLRDELNASLDDRVLSAIEKIRELKRYDELPSPRPRGYVREKLESGGVYLSVLVFGSSFLVGVVSIFLWIISQAFEDQIVWWLLIFGVFAYGWIFDAIDRRLSNKLNKDS